MNVRSSRLSWPLTIALSGAAAVGMRTVPVLGLRLGGGTTPDPVTVHVQQSDGTTPLPGVDIHYKCGSSVLDFGTTNSEGDATGSLPDGSSCTLTALYRKSSSATQTVSITNPTHVTFQTSAVTVSLEGPQRRPARWRHGVGPAGGRGGAASSI